jgi:hypothetical protein
VNEDECRCVAVGVLLLSSACDLHGDGSGTLDEVLADAAFLAAHSNDSPPSANSV